MIIPLCSHKNCKHLTKRDSLKYYPKCKKHMRMGDLFKHIYTDATATNHSVWGGEK